MTNQGAAGIKVLIVDDHRMFVDSLVRLLSDQPDLLVIGLVHRRVLRNCGSSRRVRSCWS